MRKLLLAGTAMAAASMLTATGAWAEVDVDATITKNKDITVTETITVTKDVDLVAMIDRDVVKAAESLAIINQSNYDNMACGNCAEKQDFITDSFSGNSGILTFNQAGGNMNNQGNVVSTAVDFEGRVPPPTTPPNDELPGNGEAPADPSGGFAEAQAHGGQVNQDNLVDSVNLLFRDSIMTGSVNQNSGIAFVNQASGNMNNQANALSLAVSLEVEGVALAESDLGQLNTNNYNGESRRTADSDFGAIKTAQMSGSVNGNQGIVGVNQSAGNLANQGNIFSVSMVQGQ